MPTTYQWDFNPNALPGDQYTIARVSQVDGGPGRVIFDGYGGHVMLTFRQSKGPATAPSAMDADGEIGGLSAQGYGATGYNDGHSSGKAAVVLCTKEVWTDEAQGAYVKISTTPRGSNVRADVFCVDHDGSVWVGATGTLGRFAHMICDSQGNLYSGGVKITAGSSLPALVWFLIGFGLSAALAIGPVAARVLQ